MKKRLTYSDKCKKKFGISIKVYLKKSAKELKPLYKVAKELGCSYTHAHYLADDNGIKFQNSNSVRAQLKRKNK